MIWNAILIGVIAGAIYGASAFLKKNEGQAPEQFDSPKFIATVILGGIVGFIIANTGVEVTETTLLIQLGLYGGFTVVIENIIKAIWRYIQKARGG